jgi:hypothetical protein
MKEAVEKMLRPDYYFQPPIRTISEISVFWKPRIAEDLVSGLLTLPPMAVTVHELQEGN